MKFQKRFAAGAQILATYTVAKLIDNTNSEINWLEAASPTWGDSNAYNLRSARSLDGFDVPQRLVIASVIDLPFGRGRKFGSNMNKIANAVVGGWGFVIAWALVGFGTEYALFLRLRGAAVDARALFVAGGLVLVAELAFWTILRTQATPERNVALRSLLALLGSAYAGALCAVGARPCR